MRHTRRILFDIARHLGYKTKVSAAEPTPIYTVQDLEFAYGSDPVLKGISTRIDPGEFVAVVGPNGAGKSTFLKVLAGLLQRYRGLVTFDGRPVQDWSAKDLAKRVAFVPQETHVIFPFTVREVIMMGRLPHRSRAFFDSPRDVEMSRRAMEATDTLGLSSKAFNDISGGERQRVVLASALAQDPDVLLMDEPTVYLDLKHQIHFYDIVERLNLSRRMTIISVTHDINLAARYARRMVAIHDGRIAADGAPDQVLTPQHLHEIFEITAEVFTRPDGRGRYIVPTN
jgi:iron complex transport system ATP-binding protein